MKKILTTLALSLLAAVAFAAPVSEIQARMLASRFFGGNGTAAASELTLVRVGCQKAAIAPATVCEAPTYYVFNRAEGGFVIIAGDNTVKSPILGYSFENSFPTENVPAPVEYWLDEVAGVEVAYCRTTKSAPAFSTDIRPTAGTLVVGHQTAQWNQGAPYNGESPTIDGNKCITGCVATAAAIKCRFHKWPYKGSGKIPAYTYFCDDANHNVTIPENQLGRVYDYEKMPLTYGGGASSEQNAQVAALMYDLGCTANMMFGWQGSGAYTSLLATNMVKYMHYSKDMKYTSKTGDFNSWMQKIEDELTNVGPVIYDGHSNSGGHCFIFDGFTDDHFVRVNWGWGGSGNGFFKITDSSFEYVNGQGAVLNSVPDHSGIYTPDEIADATFVKYYKTTGKFTIGIKSDVEFKVNYTFSDSEGKSVYSAQMAKGDSKEFSISSLKGVYTLSGYVVGYPDVIYSCEFEF